MTALKKINAEERERFYHGKFFEHEIRQEKHDSDVAEAECTRAIHILSRVSSFSVFFAMVQIFS